MKAVLAMKHEGARQRARIELLLKDILPGLQEVDAQLAPQELLDAVVEANVRWSMHEVLETPDGKARIDEGVMKMVGAVYELQTGRVRFLS